jgi:hypothetical protein
MDRQMETCPEVSRSHRWQLGKESASVQVPWSCTRGFRAESRSVFTHPTRNRWVATAALLRTHPFDAVEDSRQLRIDCTPFPFFEHTPTVRFRARYLSSL